MELIFLEENDDILTKHKNVRRLLAKTLKDLENESEDIPIYDMSIKFCEEDVVKNVIDTDIFNSDQSIDLIKNGVHSFNESECMSIYATEYKSKSKEEIQNTVSTLLSSTTENKMSKLDGIKHRILTVSVSEEASNKITREPSLTTSKTSTNEPAKWFAFIYQFSNIFKILL